MEDKEKKSKLFVIIMAITVILLIVIGTVLSWDIIQDGRKNNALHIEFDRMHIEQLDLNDVGKYAS